MMVIKKILVFVVPLVISFFKGQVNDDSIQTINGLYAQYYTSDVVAISFTNKWAVVIDKNNYGLERAHLVQLQTGKSEDIPSSYRTYFFGDDLLIIQLTDRTIIKTLENGIATELKGNYIYEVFENVGKILFYDRFKKEVLLFDRSGNKLRSYTYVENFGISNSRSNIVFRSSGETIKLNLKTLDLNQWQSIGKVFWQNLIGEEIVSLESDAQQYHIRRYGKLSNMKSETLRIASGFFLDSLSTTKMTIKQDRYLILPVVKATDKPGDQQAVIFYTNQNSTYKNPMSQMAVYDLLEHKWQRFPKESDLFSIQVFLDGAGTIMSYDPSLDKVQYENNTHYQMYLERNYGDDQTKIDNPYQNRSNYQYDSLTKRMIYFSEQRWRVEDTSTGLISVIPFEEPAHFVGWKYSGLSDDTSGKAYPTNQKGQWIITDNYDLFLVDIVKLSVKRLTYGRDKNISYSIPENYRTKYLKDSYWDISKPQSICINRKLILKTFNTVNYTSGIGELDMVSQKLSTLVELNDVTQEVFVSDGVITFTAHSYDQPLSIYKINRNKQLKLLYRSKGKEDESAPDVKKEIIRYKVKDQWYNAVLLYPLNYKKDKKYPVIFNIYENKSKEITTHTVPSLYTMMGFSPKHYVFQEYFVLLPDLAYEKEHVGNSISESIQELVNILKENQSVDTERMALTGVSFGGYETFLLMTKCNWFKTGLAGVGFSDLPSSAMVYYKNNGIPNYFKEERQQTRMVKSLFDNYQGYLDNSPLYHLRALKQPMLIWMGQNDGNVNPDQSRMFFLGMKRLGKKGILLEYPNEEHNLKRKDNQLDLNVKSWQWMEYQLKGKPAADWIIPLID